MINSNRLVPMGKIVGVHGRTGALKVFSYAESQATIAAGATIFLKTPQGGIQKRVIKWIKPHHRHLLILLKGVDDRNKADCLNASTLLVDRNRLPEVEKNTYYWCDLIGMTVNNSDGVYMGIIDRIIATGANDVYVIKDREKEILIPALASVVNRVDLEKRCMQVTLPEYL
jgi:16S rRNA processing protein RimM